MGRVFQLLGEDRRDPEYFEVDEVRRYLNDSYRDVARITGALEAVREANTEQDIGEYNLPSDLAEVRRVYFQDERLQPVSAYELEKIDWEWRTTTGEPRYYSIDGRNPRKMWLYPVPADGLTVSADSSVGIIVRIQRTGDDFQTRMHLGDFDFGVVTDYDEDSETVNFTGGGADDDYGLVTDIQDAAVADQYEFSSEFGIVVDLSEDADDFGDSIFQGQGAISSSDASEYGVITEWDDPDRGEQYIPDEDDGDECFGTIVNLTVPDWRYEVWYRQDPEEMESLADEPLLSPYTDMAIVYGAALRGLMRDSGALNPLLAEVYQELYQGQIQFLKGLNARRAPREQRKMGQREGQRRRNDYIRLPSNYPVVRR
jgi:hypothetical protein